MLKVTTPKGIELEGEANSLNVKTMVGEITILDQHLPLITILAAGVAHIKMASGDMRDIPVQEGFLEMNSKNQLTMLIQK